MKYQTKKMNFDNTESTTYTGINLSLIFIGDNLNKDLEKRFSAYLTYISFHYGENEDNEEENE